MGAGCGRCNLDTPVIGVVIVTHGRLAEELYLALVHVVGPQRAMSCVCVLADDDLDERRAEIASRIADVDGGNGIIVLTDMFGGTPSNLAISLMAREDMEVISGANLPMLVKLAKLRAILPLQEVSERIQEAGRKYISSASQAFPMCRIRAHRG